MSVEAHVEHTPGPVSAASSHGRLQRLLPVLRCPECRTGEIDVSGEVLRCASCGEVHPMVQGVPLLFESSVRAEFADIAERAKPPPRRGRKPSRGAAYRWREYRIEELLPPPESACDVLLLGCGDGGEIPYLAERGYRPAGFDIRCSAGTDFLADAHRIPLEDESFDVVISMQVLEHLHSPWIAVSEVARVLRPGGWFIGSVAFLKPYHGSYFHMTHAGVSLLLDRAGLQADHLAGAQSLTYTLYGELLPFGGRPFKRAVLGIIDRAVSSIRARIWSIVRRMDADVATDRFGQALPMSFRQYDRLRRAPAVVFRARKQAQPEPAPDGT